MPNGGDTPDCHRCSFFSRSEDVGRCDKHNLILPQAGWEQLCVDWEDRENKIRGPFSNLEPNILYCHSYTSAQDPEPLYSFAELDRPLILLFVLIREDSELGWVLCPFKGHYQHLPNPGDSLSIKIRDTDLSLKIVEGERSFKRTGNNSDKGKSEDAWVKSVQRVLYAPSSPNEIFDWFNECFDAEAIEEQRRNTGWEISKPVEFAAQLEVDPKGRTYKLRPDILFHGEFGRGPYKREKRAKKYRTTWLLFNFIKVVLGTRRGLAMLVKVVPNMLWQWIVWEFNFIKRLFK